MKPVVRREWLRYRRAMGRAGFIRFLVLYCFILGVFIPLQIENPSAVFIVFAVIPLYVSGPVAVDGFAGERERNTLEALITTPIRQTALLHGKTVFSTVLGSVVSWAAMLLFISWRICSGGTLPDAQAIPVVLTVGILFSLLGTLTGLNVSMGAKSVRSAQQWFSVILIAVAFGIPAFLRFLLPHVPVSCLVLIENMFSTGWYSPGTGIIYLLLIISVILLYSILRSRVSDLWRINKQ